MRRLGKVLYTTRIVRVACVGGIGFVVQTSIFETLGFYFKILLPSTAILLGAELAVLTTFFLNEKISFNDRPAAKSLWHRLTKFHLVVIGSITLQWACVFGAERATENFFVIHAAYFTGILLGFVWNYIGFHLFVWKHHTLHELQPKVEGRSKQS